MSYQLAIIAECRVVLAPNDRHRPSALTSCASPPTARASDGAVGVRLSAGQSKSRLLSSSTESVQCCTETQSLYLRSIGIYSWGCPCVLPPVLVPRLPLTVNTLMPRSPVFLDQCREAFT